MPEMLFSSNFNWDLMVTREGAARHWRNFFRLVLNVEHLVVKNHCEVENTCTVIYESEFATFKVKLEKQEDDFSIKSVPPLKHRLIHFGQDQKFEVSNSIQFQILF